METSRVVGDIYEFQGLTSGADHAKIADEIHDRSHKIWDHNIDTMVDDIKRQFATKVKEILPSVVIELDSESDGLSASTSVYLDGMPL